MIDTTQQTANNRYALHRLQRVAAVLVCLDVLFALASIAAALCIRFAGPPPAAHSDPYLTLGLVLILWRIFVAYAAGLYDFRHNLTAVDHGFAGVSAALWGVLGGYLLLAVVSFYYRPDWQLSRWVALADILLLALWFSISRMATLAWLRHSGFTIDLLVVGPSAECRALREEIVREAPKAVRLVGYYTIAEAPDTEALGNIGEIDAACLAQADQIIVAAADSTDPYVYAALNRIDPAHTEVFLFPGLNLSLLAGTRIMRVAGLPVIPLRSAYAYSLYRPIKRVLDCVGALVFLIVAAPVLFVAALAVRWSSPGPIFYVQDRVGLGGQPFRMIKLRTMIPDAEAGQGAVLSTEGDPRVTPAGRILRRYRIDELPQLWNVVRGEMSFVGPRPERQAFTDRFVQENPLYAWRTLVRPGLTGLAQIHGRYDSDYKHKLRYDLVYINTVSPATDLRILYATIRTVITGQGAI